MAMTEDIWVFMIGNSDKDNDEILEAFTLQMVKGEEMDTDLNKSWKMKGGGGGGTTTLNSLCLPGTHNFKGPPPPPPQVPQGTGKAVVPITQQYHTQCKLYGSTNCDS